MDLHKDFADLCALLNAKGVDFLIVGGYAVAVRAPAGSRHNARIIGGCTGSLLVLS